jgi:hypothetical protein
MLRWQRRTATAKQGCESGLGSNPAIPAAKRSSLVSFCGKLTDDVSAGSKAKLKADYESFCATLVSALPAAAQAAAKPACDQQDNAIP